jgi:hypothetical protein
VIPIPNQDGHQAKNRKKEGCNLKKVFSFETTEPISTNLPLSKLCPAFQTSDQDGRHSRT